MPTPKLSVPRNPVDVRDLLRLPSNSSASALLFPPYVRDRIEARLKEEASAGNLKDAAHAWSMQHTYMEAVVSDIWDAFARVLARSYGEATALLDDTRRDLGEIALAPLERTLRDLDALVDDLRQRAPADAEIPLRQASPVTNGKGEHRWREIASAQDTAYVFVPAWMREEDLERRDAPPALKFAAEMSWAAAERQASGTRDLYRAEANRARAAEQLLLFRTSVYDRVLELYRLYGSAPRYADLVGSERPDPSGDRYADIRIRFSAIQAVLAAEKPTKVYSSVTKVLQAAAKSPHLQHRYAGEDPANSLAKVVNDVMAELKVDAWRVKEKGSKKPTGRARVLLLKTVVEAWLAVDAGEGRGSHSVYLKGVTKALKEGPPFEERTGVGPE